MSVKNIWVLQAITSSWANHWPQNDVICVLRATFYTTAIFEKTIIAKKKNRVRYMYYVKVTDVGLNKSNKTLKNQVESCFSEYKYGALAPHPAASRFMSHKDGTTTSDLCHRSPRLRQLETWLPAINMYRCRQTVHHHNINRRTCPVGHTPIDL